jgi:type IV secretory pathway VirB10-like protein
MTTAMDDGVPTEFRSGSRTKRAFALTFAVAAVLGAVGFVAVRSGRFHLEASSAPAVAAVPAYVAPPPEPVPPPPPATEVAAPTPQDSAPPRLSDQQRQQLQTVDKAREQKAKTKATNAAPRPATRGKSTGFTTGGSKFDPLNASF